MHNNWRNLVRSRPVASAVLAGLLLIASFWAVASTSRFFVDYPFLYTRSKEWSNVLSESTARFFTLQQAALVMTAVVFLFPTVLIASYGLAKLEVDPLGDAFDRITRFGSPKEIAWLLAVVAGAGAAFVSWGLVRGVDLLDDERSYLFQASLLAQGTIGLPSPPNAFRNPMLLLEPMWTSKYPPGQALLLAVGVLIGEPRVVQPILTALLVLGVFALAQRAFGERQALLATVLLAVSPFAWAVGSSPAAFMSCACAVIWSFAQFARSEQTGSPGAALLCGSFMGWAFITRPYDAVALGLPMAVLLVYRAARRQVGALRRAGLIVLGFLPVACLLLVHNKFVTGDALSLVYKIDNVFQLGFTRSLPKWFNYEHTPAQALGTLVVGMIRLDMWLLAFPGGLLLALAGMLFGRSSLWHRLLLASTTCFFAAYWLLPTSGTWDIGPTYYFAIAPFIIVFVTLGVGALGQFATGRLRRAVRWSCIVGCATAWLTIVPLHWLSISELSTEVDKPWEAIRSADLGDAIVVVPSSGARRAAGYALGYPYRIATGPTTTAYLIMPSTREELNEAIRYFGHERPAYQLKLDEQWFAWHEERRFKLEPLSPSSM